MAVRTLPIPERIARLFAEGQPASAILAHGRVGGWTREDIDLVLADRGWRGRLDASGRLPREHRPAVPPPGVPLPRTGSGLALVPSQPGWSTRGVSPRPEPGHPRLASSPVRAAPDVNAPATVTALPAAARPLSPGQLPTDPAGVLALAAKSQVRAVRNRAARITESLAALRDVLVTHAESDARAARAAAERKRTLARLAEVEEQARALRAELDADRPRRKPVRAAADHSDIDHGTLSGFLKEVKRGLPKCAACQAASDEHFDGMRERRWSRRGTGAPQEPAASASPASG